MRKKTIKSDLKRIDALQDKDIDYSDIPELDENFFKKARVTMPPRKKQLTLRLDADVLAWLKGQGRGIRAGLMLSCALTTMQIKRVRITVKHAVICLFQEG
ncbi:MAG: hypothetical protein NMNS01_12130 [Nitrosomonas sp.]|nr:MAG: hypothetical protein NMNS01_12130 [Nitrosomonas sp.]